MKEYIGDSVYAEIESGYLVLTTNNGRGTDQKIMLDREVLTSLESYLETYRGLVQA